MFSNLFEKVTISDLNYYNKRTFIFFAWERKESVTRTNAERDKNFRNSHTASCNMRCENRMWHIESASDD